MQRFSGRLRDGDRAVFDEVTGFFDDPGGSGRFEVHEGGILGDDLATDRPYHLDLEDGRSVVVRLTRVHASNSAGIATMEFLLDAANSRFDPLTVPA